MFKIGLNICYFNPILSPLTVFVTESSKTKPIFRKVGKTQNLYRHAKSGTYYSLIKRSGKQFRRSLKTTDLQQAKNRLADLHREISRLKNTEDAKLSFEIIAMRWLQTKTNVAKPSSIVNGIQRTRGQRGIATTYQWNMARS